MLDNDNSVVMEGVGDGSGGGCWLVVLKDAK